MLAINLAIQQAKAGKKVLFISLEMAKREV
jgi:KaiC/GvpD/RAD55 family RecA-like ATPase